MKAIISGGGTGGHIFPAIAIANALKVRYPDAEITFVGAQGRMEMEKVPAAGYSIVGLPIAGLQRRLTLKNFAVPFKMLHSQLLVRKVIKRIKPDIVIGVGGYASAPTLRTASRMGYTTMLQEQNSYPGLTNKMLSHSAAKICVAYEGLERFFPPEKLVLTGNPVRAEIENNQCSREQGLAHFDLTPTLQTVLLVGGSLGARSMNTMIEENLEFFRQHNVQLIWQTGKQMYEEARQLVSTAGLEHLVKVHQFVTRMDMAYAAADIVISRAGALAISELCLVGKPCLLIPSPNVTEDHQTKNAMALANKVAAFVVRDDSVAKNGISMLQQLLSDTSMQEAAGKAIRQMGFPHAADRIVDEIESLISNKKHQ